MLQNFQAGLGSAGRVAHGRPCKHPRQRAVGDAVNVLLRGEGRADGAVVELAGQGAEEQTAMDGGVCIDLRENVQQSLLGGIGGQQKLLYRHAHLGAAGQLPYRYSSLSWWASFS